MQVRANGISIEIEDTGTGEPLLLVMGLGMQLVAWPDELVAELTARGFRVIRFDNRDIGLSQDFDHVGVPNLAWSSMRWMMNLPVASPYTLADMAADGFGLLDALGIESAHVCGVSMGGMIAQHMAATWPERVKSLTLSMTSSGASTLARPSARALHALLSRPRSNGRPGSDVDTIVDHFVRLFEVIGSPGYPTPPALLRARLTAAVRRAWRPNGSLRQLTAVAADGDRSRFLARIASPTAIVHGAADPLVPVDAAHDLHRKIRGAQVDIVDGMGHDLPAALMPRLASVISSVADPALRPRAAATG